MKKFKYETLEEIKPRLYHGDNVFIAQLVAKKYTKRTVEAQLAGLRTLKEPVIEAANKLIESREMLLEKSI